MSMDERLIGTWRLLTVQVEMQDTDEVREEGGQGSLVVTPEGRLITVTTAPDRIAPSTDADAAALLVNMVCYSGRVRLDGPGRFVTHVDMAWHPSWLGTEQSRNFSISGDILSVRTDPLHHPAYPGRVVSHMLVWQREA